MSERTLTQQTLGKRIEKLTYADLTKYFKSPRKESDLREFKAFIDDPKGGEGGIQAVIRTICAFLNSEGGLLIWGAPVGKAPVPGAEKEFAGPLTDVGNNYGDDQLSDKVFDSLSPSPQDVKIRKLTNGKQRVYVFEVPRSPYAPHQVKEKGAYWFRFNATTKPAPHHFVEALMRRVTFPNIAPYLRIGSVTRNDRGVYELYFHVFCVNHSRLQNETDISLTIRCLQATFASTQFNDKRWLITANGRQLHFMDVKPILHYGGHHAEQFRVQLDPAVNEGDTIELLLFLGGRHSPLKNSAYTVRITPCTRDCGTTIVAKKENTLASSNERDDDSHDKILRQLLGH